jgi:hypothetical protein
MKKGEEKKEMSMVEETGVTYMRTFSSQEEAERFNMVKDLEKSDMEKFQSFCNMLRMQKIYSRAKIYDMKNIK